MLSMRDGVVRRAHASSDADSARMADLSNRVELSYRGIDFRKRRTAVAPIFQKPCTAAADGQLGGLDRNFRQRREVVGTQATREHGANHFGVRGGLHQDARVVHRAKFIGVQFDR